LFSLDRLEVKVYAGIVVKVKDSTNIIRLASHKAQTIAKGFYIKVFEDFGLAIPFGTHDAPR
jgi:hypothetical protein